MIFQIFLSVIVIILLIILFLLFRRLSAMAEQSSSTDERIRKYEESTDRLLAEQRRQYESQIAGMEQRLEAQKAELQRTSALEFQNLANEALSRQTERLANSNRSEISAILNPLKENIGEFRKAVDNSYMKESSSREALKQQIDLLMNANSEIGKETRRLADALRGNTRLQGRIGEQVMERILTAVGFVEDVHYTTQVTSADGRQLADDDGKRQRPDLIFLLPDGAKLVIDSKMSMTAYLNYCDAKSKEDEKQALKAHVSSVKRHVDELARTQYHKSIPGAIEHTLMFMPNDAAYIAALRADATIPEYALNKNIVIVSPAHILSVVQLISQLWRVDNQNKNAMEIAELGGRLYDKFANFLTDFEGIRRNLELTSKAYDKCQRHISEGGVSLLSRAEKLKELGAKTTKNIPNTKE